MCQLPASTSTPGCNAYTTAHLTTPYSPTGIWQCGPGRPLTYCPSDRLPLPNGTGVRERPRRLTLEVSLRHATLTGLFGSSWTLTSTRTVELEPVDA
jgi:hypothetical protein